MNEDKQVANNNLGCCPGRESDVTIGDLDNC